MSSLPMINGIVMRLSFVSVEVNKLFAIVVFPPVLV